MCNDSLRCCIDGSPIGELISIWSEKTPRLSPCLEHTLFIWIPCALFLITLPFEVIKLIRAKRNVDEKNLSVESRGKRRYLFVARMTCLLFIWICSAIRAIMIKDIDIASNSILSAFILYPITCICLVLITLLRHGRLVAPPSAYTWITLFAFTIFGIPEFVSSIQYAQDGRVGTIAVIAYFIQYIFILLALLTFSISDPLRDQESREWPEESLSFPNKLVFCWFLKLLVKGYRNVLSIQDMFIVSKEEETRPVYEQFEKNLKREFGNPQKPNPGDWSMIKVLTRTFYKPVLTAAFLEFIYVLAVFISPVLIQWLMEFVRDKEEPLWHGFVYCAILFSGTLLKSFSNQFHYHYMNKLGVRARAAIVASVYRKALSMSSGARRESNTGEIVNLMAVDSTRFVDVAPWLQMLWSAPFQVCFGLYFIYGVVGHAIWAGVGVMAVIFSCTSIVSKQMQKLQMKQLHEKDRRIKLLSEILNGMKVVKLYAWEPAFENLIEKIRATELKHLKRSSYLFGVIEVSYCCTNLLACMAIFGVYCLLNPTHNVTAEVAFIVMTVFNIIYVPFTQLPLAASYTMMTLASISRLRKYFNGGDLIGYVECRQKSDVAIEMDHASFTWEHDTKDCFLQNIDLQVNHGRLVAVVGSVGSGKSSLINAMCGEMIKRSGSVYVNGTIAYVAQQAWIQNMTVRDNILFGLSYDEKRYQKVVQACALKPDLALLTNGDMTIIGERGSNLSGGQKQRISLARAVYQDADIYLLDDPLSAVDVHVGKCIFDEVIGPNGLLKKKARIFVTHGINYLPYCDNIILMENGGFLATGTFNRLAQQHEAYAEFVRQNLMPKREDAVAARKLSATTLLSSFRQSQTSIISDRQQKLTNSDARETEEDESNEEEEVHVGKIGWKTYWSYARYSGFALFMHSIFIGLSEFSYMGGSMWLEIWTDTVPIPGSNCSHPEDVISSGEGIGVLGAFTAVQFVTTVIFALYFVWFLMLASTKIHKRLLTSILRAPMSFFDTTPSGRLTNRFGKDMNTIDNQIPTSASAVIHFGIILIAFIIPIFYAMPIFGAIMLPLLILYVFFQKFYVASSRQFRRLEAITRSPIYSHFQESIHGLATIRAYGQQERFSIESDRLVDINDSVQMTLLASNRWLGVQLDFIGNLVVAGASLTAVLGRTTMLPGLVGLAVSYALGITDILNWGIREISLLETEVVALERVNEYMDTKSEAEWTSDDPNGISTTRNDDPKTISMTRNWPNRGVVEFKNYSTSYRSELPLVLKEFKCTIRAGEKVGVVGRTGAGKSSLTLALFRLIEPVIGTISVDDVDIAQLGLHDLRRKLTIIPQEPVLFSGTLRQNIDPFEQYADAELFRALKLSHLNAFVANLEGGLSHEISEGGANLSLGQRQLLCLARALLRKSKILVLDEATASVDVETDALIQRTVREQFSDCTVITIAHRLNTILDCDRIMVLDSGRLIEFNSPSALIEDDRSEFGRMIQEAGIRVTQNDLKIMNF